MYYSQPRPQSPGRLHDPSAPWSRIQQHPMLAQASGPQPSPAPQQSSYGLVQYTNGGAHHNPNLVPHHYIPNHYQSPNHLHRQAAATPPPQPAAPIPKHWQSQLDHADACRKAGSPHARARTAATNTRNTTKSVIAITDPNRKAENGHVNGHGSNQGSVSEVASEAGTEGHPSATVPPVLSPPPPRPTVPRKPQSSWSALDLGGMRLKNLAPTIFKYDHLTTLYLNHNQLNHITPAISSLRNLTVLDLSCNLLDTLPAEIGMCSSLEHLWLFDNNFETLPPELGSLHQLKLLGIEGNPLQTALLNIIQTQGTPALIAYLRDSCPVPMPPPERQWRSLQTEAERKFQEMDPNPETFSVLTYNILNEKFATSSMYGYTPSWALSWSYRRELILTELKTYDADFLCLQEADMSIMDDYFLPQLKDRDYEGIFSPKGRARNMAESDRRHVDGCAIFYKSNKYRLVKQITVDFAQVAIQRDDFTKNNDMFDRLLARDDVALAALFENNETGTRIIIFNVHILWNPVFRDVKLVQTGIAMDSLKGIAQWFAALPPRPPPLPTDDLPRNFEPTYSADGHDIPIIVAGDFNSVPGSGVYDYMADGNVPSTHPDFMDYIYGKFTADGLSHEFGLRSAYAGFAEPPITNHVPSFEGPIDHIWYNSKALSVNTALGEVDPEYMSKVVGFPNAHFPSDHICIVAEFRVKKESTLPTRPLGNTPFAFPTAAS